MKKLVKTKVSAKDKKLDEEFDRIKNATEPKLQRLRDEYGATVEFIRALVAKHNGRVVPMFGIVFSTEGKVSDKVKNLTAFAKDIDFLLSLPPLTKTVKETVEHRVLMFPVLSFPLWVRLMVSFPLLALGISGVWDWVIDRKGAQEHMTKDADDDFLED